MEFSCPACGCGLRLRRRYFRALYTISYAIAVLIAYFLGFRDDALYAAGILSVLPVYFIVTTLNMRLFQPEVEISGEFRGILHPGEPQDPSLPAEPIVLGEAKSRTSTKDPSGHTVWARLRAFSRPDTLEGWVIYLGFVSLLAYNAYLVAAPILYKLLPEFNATKRGPSSFPATVHIGENTLEFSNGSTLTWRCSVFLGRYGSYSTSVDVNAGATRAVAYEDFLAGDDEHRGADAETRQTAARQEVIAICTDSAGRSHSWTFN
jgi:hypothetical protein